MCVVTVHGIQLEKETSVALCVCLSLSLSVSVVSQAADMVMDVGVAMCGTQIYSLCAHDDE